MMMAQPIFNQSEFIQFVLKQIHKQNPLVNVERASSSDPLQFTITHAETNVKGLMNLHNIWEDYIRTGDMNIIISFLNHQQLASNFTKRMEKDFKGVDLTKIYPVIRHPEFRTSQPNIQDYIFDNAIPRLDSLFAENHTGYYVFLTKQLIQPALVYKNEEEIKQHAYDNLRKKGWNPPMMEMPAPSFVQQGTLHIFAKTDYPFQHQFLLPDLVKGHLPSSFLFAIPARDMAVVLTTNNAVTSSILAKRTAIKSGLTEFVANCFRGEPRPISQNIYWSYNGRVYFL